MAGSVIKNVEDFNGKHNFLAEELLQPMVDKSDAGRVNMFTGHITQTVVLNKPERPRVFSRFENTVGSYTSAVKIIPDNAELVGIFEKNPLQKVYAIRYKDTGKMDIHFAKPARHLTENFGYRLTDGIPSDATVGHDLPKDTVIQNWPCTDEYGNFTYGVNFRTIYMNLQGKTYEDGLVASESAAKRLAHTAIETITVVMNANDLTVNRCGTPEYHKGFPDVGEMITDGILMARRRINHESILFDLSANQLSKINTEADTVFYAKGQVIDINVFSNLSDIELDKHAFNRQILDYHLKWVEFREWFDTTFSECLAKGADAYSSDVGYWSRICRDTKEGKWRHERSEFEGIVIQFTIAMECPAVPGSKITNRHGGKGVLSMILPDHLMPTTVDGRPIDLVVNSLGVVNRLNISQLYESEINYIADCVSIQMKPLKGQARVDLMMKFYSMAAVAQHAWLSSHLGNDELQQMADEIADGVEPFYVEQAPFFGNTTPDELIAMYVEFGVERMEFNDIEEAMIPGYNYYMKLRHEPSSKMSARSAKHLSIGGVPTKNSRGVRASTEHHSTTPIRLGEQELQNLLIANKPDELKRMLRIYATDDLSRESAIAELATRPDPFTDKPISVRGSGLTRPVAGFKALLESIGYELDTGNEEDDETTNQEG